MFERMLEVAGGIGIFICGVVLLVAVVAVIIVLAHIQRSKIRVPRGVEVFTRDAQFPVFVDTAHPQRVNLELAKSNAPKIIHEHLERLFGENEIAYHYALLNPKYLGAIEEYRVRVISKKGLYDLRNGVESQPREDVRIHISAIKPL